MLTSEGTPSVFLAENRCGRFESSFGPVRVEDSTSIWLQGMAGAVLGLWSSHGEGEFSKLARVSDQPPISATVNNGTIPYLFQEDSPTAHQMS